MNDVVGVFLLELTFKNQRRNEDTFDWVLTSKS